ncbi:MAG: ABC-F family ATP-binding cassette domain-containing protein [Bellilinea sp.]
MIHAEIFENKLFFEGWFSSIDSRRLLRAVPAIGQSIWYDFSATSQIQVLHIMIAVTLDKITYTYVSTPIVADLSWEIHDDRVVGLIGPNGSGKSTLLRLIAGELSPDSGFLVRKKGLTMGYLQQDVQLTPGHTLLQEVLAASGELARVEDELQKVEASLADPVVYGDPKMLARVSDRQEKLLNEFESLGGSNFDSRVRSTLRGLGFSPADFDLPVEALSGGQKKLAGLARLLILQPDLLLLDEPDNHLDLAGKAFLERLIREYRGAVVIVSHDRYLLDLVADEIADLEDGKMTIYPGNYSEYAFEKKTRLMRQQQMFQVQQKEIRRLEQSAQRLLVWGRTYDNEKLIIRGKNILDRLERMDKIDRPVLERRRMGLELRGWVGSQKVLELVNLGKSYASADGAQALFSGLNARLDHGERAGLVGANGAGKSVLFRIILEQEAASEGEVIIGPSVKVGYYAQQHETLDPQQTLMDAVRLGANMSEEKAAALLNKFLFTYLQSSEHVGQLSGGERSRLQLALLMLSGANFLLLDEPTNHLDIPSAEVLETALEDFEGTVLVISHDRYFLDQVVGRILELQGGQLQDLAGNYSQSRALASD